MVSTLHGRGNTQAGVCVRRFHRLPPLDGADRIDVQLIEERLGHRVLGAQPTRATGPTSPSLAPVAPRSISSDQEYARRQRELGPPLNAGGVELRAGQVDVVVADPAVEGLRQWSVLV